MGRRLEDGFERAAGWRLFSTCRIFFSWPGMGRLGVEAALGRDYPLVMAVTLVVSAGVVVASILADMVQMMIDPRVRVG